MIQISYDNDTSVCVARWAIFINSCRHQGQIVIPIKQSSSPFKVSKGRRCSWYTAVNSSTNWKACDTQSDYDIYVTSITWMMYVTIRS